MKVRISRDEWYCAYFSDYDNAPEYDMNPFKVMFCKLVHWMFRISQRFLEESESREYNSKGKVKTKEEKKIEQKALTKSRLEKLTVDFDYEANT